VLVVGLLGFFVAMNYDTIIAGQTENTIGPNQFNAMVGAAAVAAAGGVIAFLGLVRARPASSPTALAGPAKKTPGAPPSPPRVESRPGPVTEAPPEPEEPVPELYAEPEPVMAEPSPAPAVAAVASVDIVVEEEEEAEVDVVITREPEPAVEAAPRAPPVVDMSPPSLDFPSASPAPPKDELEDLFGELESHVAAASDEEVHYECPNCHGIVKEDDTTCPHCQVVFEG
jgi:hypothetical protein